MDLWLWYSRYHPQEMRWEGNIVCTEVLVPLGNMGCILSTFPQPKLNTSINFHI